MDLNRTQLKQLHEALLDAYPNEEDLEQLVYFHLGQNLHAIARSGDLRYVTYTLIRWAQAKGRVEELIRAALDQNPDNPKLKAFANQDGIRYIFFLRSITGQTNPNKLIRFRSEDDAPSLITDFSLLNQPNKLIQSHSEDDAPSLITDFSLLNQPNKLIQSRSEDDAPSLITDFSFLNQPNKLIQSRSEDDAPSDINRQNRVNRLCNSLDTPLILVWLLLYSIFDPDYVEEGRMQLDDTQRGRMQQIGSRLASTLIYLPLCLGALLVIAVGKTDSIVWFFDYWAWIIGLVVILLLWGLSMWFQPPSGWDNNRTTTIVVHCAFITAAIMFILVSWALIGVSVSNIWTFVSTTVSLISASIVALGIASAVGLMNLVDGYLDHSRFIMFFFSLLVWGLISPFDLLKSSAGWDIFSLLFFYLVVLLLGGGLLSLVLYLLLSACVGTNRNRLAGILILPVLFLSDAWMITQLFITWGWI